MEEIKINNIAEEFYKKYTKEIYPILESFEPERKQLFKKNLFLGILTLIVSIVGVAAFFLPITTNMPIVSSQLYFLIVILSPFVTVFVPIKYFTTMSKSDSEFRYKIKKKCLKKILEVFGNIEWKNTKSDKSLLLSDEELNASGLFMDFNTRRTDDEFFGTFNNVNFTVCETEMLDVRRNGNKTYAVPVFKGVIAMFDFNKQIKNRTVVATKGSYTKKSNLWFNMTLTIIMSAYLLLEHRLKNPDGSLWMLAVILVAVDIIIFLILKAKQDSEEVLDEVKLEDPVFSKKFNVYSSDQVEARYLVTTAFMERLLNIKTAFDTKHIKCAFFDENRLMISLPTNKNVFEIGETCTSLQNPKSINCLYNELISILKLIEYFKLNEKTGL